MTGGQSLLWDTVLVTAGLAAGLAGLGAIVVGGRDYLARRRLEQELARELLRLQQTKRELESLHRARLQDLQQLLQVVYVGIFWAYCLTPPFVVKLEIRDLC